MALEQFAIVTGVVLGFWTGYFTRDCTCNVVILCKIVVSLILSLIVHGSISWRLPLAIQLIPAFILAFGCIFLPPSPRLLIYQGRNEEALRTLTRLRVRTPKEELTDPLLKVGATDGHLSIPTLMEVPQVEFLEMQVEAELINRAVASVPNKQPLELEIYGWTRLFTPKYVDRIMVGIVIMFFQRGCPVMNRYLTELRLLCIYVEWSGINALIYYGPILMERIGITGGELSGSGGIGIIQFLAVIPAIIYIDRLGKVLHTNHLIAEVNMEFLR